MEKLKFHQAIEMLRLQERMNSTVNPAWLDAGYPFLRAVVLEAGEALDHLGWKWWKAQTSDLKQAQIELIDVLHFMLSHALIEAKGDCTVAAAAIVDQSNPAQEFIYFDGKRYSLHDSDPRSMLELLCGLAVSRRCIFPVLEACFRTCHLNWEKAATQYVSKNVLNIFRQNNGYKQGTYVKLWNGREDNLILAELINSMHTDAPNFSENLFMALQNCYQIELERIDKVVL
jgi:hypothetical protein